MNHITFSVSHEIEEVSPPCASPGPRLYSVLHHPLEEGELSAGEVDSEPSQCVHQPRRHQQGHHLVISITSWDFTYTSLFPHDMMRDKYSIHWNTIHKSIGAA